MILKCRGWNYPIYILTFLLLLVSRCKKDDEGELSVTTSDVSDISQNIAFTGGTIVSAGGARITSRGVCWSTGIMPTLKDSKTADGTGTGNFTSKISGLSSSTTYYVRAYATSNLDTAYGNALLFVTAVGINDTVTDIDNNIYHTLTIGTQVWTVENLNVTHYRNGDSIPNVTDYMQWSNLNATGAYCNYENKASNAGVYGRLYNWYALSDNRNICPSGWHVPSDADWVTLTSYVGENPARQLKQRGTFNWSSPNYLASNNSGFSALPGGCRDHWGSFLFLHYSGFWWSVDAWYFNLESDSSEAYRGGFDKNTGFSVRCIKD
jgi:uncharacterized protein (TIGR02145 family)